MATRYRKHIPKWFSQLVMGTRFWRLGFEEYIEPKFYSSTVELDWDTLGPLINDAIRGWSVGPVMEVKVPLNTPELKIRS